MQDEQKKLMRRFTFLWFISLGLLLVMFFLAIGNYKDDTREYIQNELAVGFEQFEDRPLPEPLHGKDGADGKDGVTTIVEQQTIVHDPVHIQPAAPIQGPQGPAGKDGKDAVQIDIRLNPVTGDLEKVVGDDDFAEILVPCKDLLKRCEVLP